MNFEIKKIKLKKCLNQHIRKKTDLVLKLRGKRDAQFVRMKNLV